MYTNIIKLTAYELTILFLFLETCKMNTASTFSQETCEHN